MRCLQMQDAEPSNAVAPPSQNIWSELAGVNVTHVAKHLHQTLNVETDGAFCEDDVLLPAHYEIRCLAKIVL